MEVNGWEQRKTDENEWKYMRTDENKGKQMRMNEAHWVMRCALHPHYEQRCSYWEWTMKCVPLVLSGPLSDLNNSRCTADTSTDTIKTSTIMTCVIFKYLTHSSFIYIFILLLVLILYGTLATMCLYLQYFTGWVKYLTITHVIKVEILIVSLLVCAVQWLLFKYQYYESLTLVRTHSLSIQELGTFSFIDLLIHWFIDLQFGPWE